MDPEIAALDSLNAEHIADLARTSIHGQWVAQMSSKYPGITDPRLTAANGTHTFNSTDILAEFHGIQQELAGSGADVVLLQSSDYGTGQGYQGHTVWVTFALGNWGSLEEVNSWCTHQFPGHTGADLKNLCFPKTLASR